ncbi:MAG: hypothetical protein AAGK00_19675 [Pseudomonadota bacterium]
MTEWHWYRAHGLTVRSEIELPELMPGSPGPADLSIRLDPLPAQTFDGLDRSTPRIGGFRPTDAGYFVRFGMIAHFLVVERNTVLVTTIDGHDPGILRLVICGTIMGLILKMHGRLPMHAAAVVTPTGVALFVGDSGAGKSTLTAHLAASGFQVLSDDVTALANAPGGGMVAWPGTGVLKVKRDALLKLGTQPDTLPPVALRDDKHFLVNDTDPADRPFPISEVFQLAEGDGSPQIARLEPRSAIEALAGNTYRQGQTLLLGDQVAQFEKLGRLCQTADVYRLKRPWDATRVGETAAFLADHWRSMMATGRDSASG